MALTIPTRPDFNFKSTVESHGWLALHPFSYEDETLRRVHRLDDGKLVRLTLGPTRNGLSVDVEGLDGKLTTKQKAQIVRDVSQILALDWDLSAFYKATGDKPECAWVLAQKAGRLLVCPTVWEDLAKTLLTTNTTWAQTKNMVKRLCALGDEYARGLHAFPTPQQIADMPFEEFAEAIRAGYRAEYLHTLAKRIASGELDVESWRKLPSAELYKKIRGVRGFGDYAAGTMLRLLGHFDKIAIDTECRSAFKKNTGSETATDAEIRAHYDAFGEWRGLVMWMDVLRS